MLKQYKIVLGFALCVSSAVMYGIREPAKCHQIIILKLKRLFYQLKQVAERQSTPVNKYTKEVIFYPNSKAVKIQHASGNVHHFENALDVDAFILKGASNNFYEIVHWDDRENHPLYPFLRDNGILDSKNAPDLLPKTIM